MKTKHYFAKNISKLAGLILAMFLVVSCTYDYFEDENNFRIYVPQIEEGSIDNFYISFHDLAGNHVYTRIIDAPFNKNELMAKGILQFKLPPGEFTVSCFANYELGTEPSGATLRDSYKGYNVDLNTNRYQARISNPRAVLSQVKVYPIGHPEGLKELVVNIDANQCFKSRIISNFLELPSGVTRVDINYYGVATRINFNGLLNSFTRDDITFSSNDLTLMSGAKIVSDLVGPSDNLFVSKVVLSTRADATDPPVPVSVVINFYNGEAIIGTTTFSSTDLANLAADNKPTDGDGVPLTSLILQPRKTFIFTFKGYTVVSLKLVDWGDIESGEITPM